MIKIDDLILLLKDGWVAMDEHGLWVWFRNKPYISHDEILRFGYWECEETSIDWNNEWQVYINLYECFYIEPVDDWTKSLIKIKNGKGKKDD